MNQLTDRRQFLVRAIRFGSLYSMLGRLSEPAASASLLKPSTVVSRVLVLAPEQEEGPFFIEQARVRRDITDGRPGVPLLLQIKVVNSRERGAPLPKCAIDIWHCDAGGSYSGFGDIELPPPGQLGEKAPRMRPPPGFFQPSNLRHAVHKPIPVNDSRFLRGVQLTDQDGLAYFETIFPGWYHGRAIHAHLKVHVDGQFSDNYTAYDGGHIAHTGQLFFPEEISERIMQEDPYMLHKGERLLQSEDGIFMHEQGAKSMVSLRMLDPKSVRAGLVGTISLTVDPLARPGLAAFSS